MKKNSDIIVCGAGLVGSIMALSLADAGLNISLVDESTTDKKLDVHFDGRSYAVGKSTVRMLSALNIWNAIEKDCEPILHVKISEGHAGKGASPFYLNLDHSEFSEGPIGFMIEDRFLRKVLLEKVNAHPKINNLWGRQILKQDVLPFGINATLSGDILIGAKLLIGADGRESRVAINSGIKTSIYEYNQLGLVSAISHEHDHLGEAHQFFMPTGPIAVLPLKGKRSSIVWTHEKTGGERICNLSDQEYLNELSLRFGNFRGKICLEGKRFHYPLKLMFAEKLIAERVAIIGDAAHSIHPLAGQGLNLGMRDAACLAEVLVEASRRGEDFGQQDVLTRYNSWRGLDRYTTFLITHGVNGLFSNDIIALRILRAMSMKAIGKIPILKRNIVNEANGLIGDLPLLMKGVNL